MRVPGSEERESGVTDHGYRRGGFRGHRPRLRDTKRGVGGDGKRNSRGIVRIFLTSERALVRYLAT
jgi:hypothetical protein